MHALIDILILLIAAKLAAEVAERVGLPPVVGEIVAGIAIGPSLLGLVKPNEVLLVLGQIGVILLLLEVGLEMDLGELGAVGRAAISVAVIGVVVPFAAGFGVGMALGWETNEAIFVGAALTATSVGISARVFGDLKALATVEARTVLGAAVVDDVLGLIILTVVVRLVEAGTVSLFDVGKIIFIAVAFLVAAVVIGVRFVPPLFAAISRHSRSPGTLVALALAFALGVSELASAAKLAPIVGAFVAGIALARAPVADRVRRELAPVGHLLIPVFFLQIGIDTDVRQFLKPSVLGVAALLLVVGIIGKMVAASGMVGAPGDRLLVGIGMLPRGEVGLIFATIGLDNKVFGEDIYAALLLMVLVSTLITPPLLRSRLIKIRRARSKTAGPAGATIAKYGAVPPEGWLRINDDVIELAGIPGADQTLVVALQAALLGEQARPGTDLLDWLGSLPDEPLDWPRRATVAGAEARAALQQLLDQGGPRAWRFLAVTGVLERALPELAEAVGRRSADPFDLDPVASLRWPRLGRLLELFAGLDRASESTRLPTSERHELALAALVLDAAQASGKSPGELAERLVDRLDLAESLASSVVKLAADADLLVGIARRIDGFDRDVILGLAEHLQSVSQVRALELLVSCRDDLENRDQAAVSELADLVVATIERPLPLSSSGDARQRRTAAMSLVSELGARELLANAASSYVVTQSPTDLARQVMLCHPRPERGEVRVTSKLVAEGRWSIAIATIDKVGVLAHMAEALDELDLSVNEANSVLLSNGTALSVFGVSARAVPSEQRIASTVQARLVLPLGSSATVDAEIDFDDSASPWNTVCSVRAPDRQGLLAALATAFAAAESSVHSARVATVDGVAVDQFELSGAGERKLSQTQKELITTTLHTGLSHSHSRWRRVRASSK